MRADLYDVLLDEITSAVTFSPDQPDEGPESTLKALWHAAAGNPRSARTATQHELENLTDAQAEVLRHMLAERRSGRPLMQITGRAHFMGLELEFAPDVFVVRPETEILGRSAIEFLQTREKPILVDVGCGSGNLTCGISHALAGLRVHAIDVLESCVQLTTRNAARCGVADRVLVARGDLFSPLEGRNLEQSLDAVICNPPYIASSRLKGDRAYLVAYEPREAFDGGPFGFAMQQRLIKESLRFLKPGGGLLFEFGAGQHGQVQGLIRRAGGYARIDLKTDEAGVARVVVAQKAD
jgi:release factor glutamine methyltransferase